MSTGVTTFPVGDSPDDLSEHRTGSDVELRELVYQSLERDGLIGRLKAQLRAAVFKTIEKAANPSGSTPTLSSPRIPDSSNGRVCHGLVLDWLEHSRLLYTQDVLKVETTGANHSAPLTKVELLHQLHFGTTPPESRSLLQVLLEKSSTPTAAATTTTTTTATTARALSSLPENVKQSIDKQFPSEKINDLNRVREHFRSIFSSAFDSTVLDTYLNKNISSTLSSIAKFEYEQICLKWMQACNAALTPTIVPSKQSSPAPPAQPVSARSAAVGGSQTTRARRATSPPSDSNSSSSSSTSQSDHPRRGGFNFPLPTTLGTNKSVIKKSTDEAPPPLIDFGGAGGDDDDDDTSTSLLSKRNATPASLDRLKTIDDIIRGDETPRTRTNIQKMPNINGTKEIPVEYDDESQISSIDDVTVDKASPSPSAPIDFLDDL